MGMDVDAVAAHIDIEKLEKLLGDLPHGERSDIADDIEAFVKQMYEKYQNKIQK